MISKIEFEVIDFLFKSPNIDEEKFSKEIESLLKDKLIKHRIVDYKRMKNVLGLVPIYDGFEVTPLGQRAYEEYKNFILNEERENHTVEIAEKANLLANEANQISQKANKKASNANIIAIFALIAPFIISAVSLIFSILSYVNGLKQL